MFGQNGVREYTYVYGQLFKANLIAYLSYSPKLIFHQKQIGVTVIITRNTNTRDSNFLVNNHILNLTRLLGFFFQF